jgi:hypothetical protein
MVRVTNGNAPAEAFAKLNEIQQQQAARANASQRFISDVKTQTFMSFDWAEFLSSAPLTLSLMGLCSIAAATTPAGLTMTLDPPASGFKYLK